MKPTSKMIDQALLETAIDQFGRLGFEGASTREIARASGTTMSSITYHFGGKLGLYLAAADHIAESIAAIQRPSLITAQYSAGQSREAAIEALLSVLDGLAQMMLRPETEAWSRFITREQQEPTEAFERLFKGAMQMVVETINDLIGCARGDLNEREVRAVGILLFGQALILRAGRASVCRAFGVDRIEEAESTLLRSLLRANASLILSHLP